MTRVKERETKRVTSTEPWLWVMEYLSIFPQIPTSLLLDVVEAAPLMPDEEGRKTKMEMVALRCLEDPPRGTPRSLKELNGGEAGVSKWDVRSFARRKSAARPKCTLQQLRDGTLGVGCRPPPCTTSSAEATGGSRDDGMAGTEPANFADRYLSRSRSAVETEGNTVHDALGNEDGAAGDDLGDENLLLSKRRMSGLVNEEVVETGGQNMSLLRSDDEEHASLRPPITEGNDALQSSGNENGIERDYLDSGNTLPAKRDRSPSVYREHDIADAVDDCRSKVKRLMPDSDIEQPRKTPDSNADPDANRKIEHDQNHKRHTSIMSEDKPGEGYSTDGLVDESGHAATTPPGDVPSVRSPPPGDSVDELNDLNDCSLKPTSSKGFCKSTSIDEEECSMENNFAEDASDDTDEYHHLRVDVAMMKDRFLSSQCTVSDDHNLCTKCNLDGQLLICSTVGCPLVVHEKCLGSSPKYKSRNLYCPFCAYSLTISELEEALKKASLARKKLNAFIHEEHPSKGGSERLNNKEDGNSRRNQKEGPLQNIDNNGHLEDGRAIEGNACAVDDHHSKKRKGNPQLVLPPRSCSDANVLGRQEDHTRVDPKSSDKASSEDNRVVFSKKRKADKKACSEFLEQEAAELLANLASAADDETDNSNHSRRSRRRGKKCTYTYPAIPHLTRRRVPWTAEEEEMLKEGVQKFSSASDNMPWRMILEYGSSIFCKGRTPIDLKDKWRNMCKAKA